jgi:hypothetical protein
VLKGTPGGFTFLLVKVVADIGTPAEFTKSTFLKVAPESFEMYRYPEVAVIGHFVPVDITITDPVPSVAINEVRDET